MVDLRRDGPSWRVAGVFLSAHCFGRASGYEGPDLSRFEWPVEPGFGGPVVWVADARNANYPSRTTCERGHHFVETCSGQRLRYRYPVHHDRNIGSRESPARFHPAAPGCVGSDHIDPVQASTVPGARECFWDHEARFRGWQESGSGVTPYDRYLREVAGF